MHFIFLHLSITILQHGHYTPNPLRTGFSLATHSVVPPVLHDCKTTADWHLSLSDSGEPSVLLQDQNFFRLSDSESHSYRVFSFGLFYIYFPFSFDF